MKLVNQDNKKRRNSKYFRITTIMLCAIYSMANYVMVRADDKKTNVAEVTNGIEILKTLALSLVQGVGVIFLAWGLLDFATAYSAHDTSQQSIAIKKCVGGVVAIAVPGIVKLFV
ncbi:MAG: hypothetical protein NC293_03565 [Roseburia sp.]|nr:hypothetical protein [Roseburia sp.]